MNAKVYSHEKLIGTVLLQVGDEQMGGVFGEFLPHENYYKDIQKVVWEFWKTSTPNYALWHSLRFNVQLENGYFIFPEGGFTFDDISEMPNEPKRMDIAGVDSESIEEFFLHKKQQFVIEPWIKLTIAQKISFEDELRRELGLNAKKNLLSTILRSKRKHILSGFEFSAVCKNERNDDVLFQIRKSDTHMKFALVHLTWISKKESKDYPITSFYNNFEQFKLSKIYSNEIDT
jgi:hypothetical protein